MYQDAKRIFITDYSERNPSIKKAVCFNNDDMINEESLKLALKEAGMAARGLPHQYREGKDLFWIRAIVLVQKRSMEECYCIYEQNADRYMRLLYDFGGSSPIFAIKGIFPYIYLDETVFLPKGGIQNERQFLKSELSDRFTEEDIDSMSDSEVKKALVNEGIRLQLMNREVDRQQNIVNEGSDLDGTVIKEVEEARFEAEYAALYKDGVSLKELKELREEFEHRNDNVIAKEVPDDIDVLREEMEQSDSAAKNTSVSSEGEFDVHEIDYAVIKKEAENAKQASLDRNVRRCRRNAEENAKKREGSLFENEFGEIEKVEVAYIPKTNIPIELKEELTPKRGRPRKTEEEKAATRKARLERRKQAYKRTSTVKSKRNTKK